MSFKTNLTADGRSGSVKCTGILYQIEAEGSFGGGTITPQKQSYDGTWIDVGSSTLTANGAINVEVPIGSEIAANLTGSSSPDLIVHIIRIR